MCDISVHWCKGLVFKKIMLNGVIIDEWPLLVATHVIELKVSTGIDLR